MLEVLREYIDLEFREIMDDEASAIITPTYDGI